MNKPILQLADVSKHFYQGDECLEVLQSVNLEIRPKEVVALVGPSGSGKSTLLQIAGLLEQPSSGTVFLGGVDCSHSSDKVRTSMRRDYLGFVYQYHNLLTDFSALENVILPQMIANKNIKEAQEKAAWLLERLGLKERLKHRPAELSGGEQQRVAIARALANTPKMLLADEPTGNLDPNTSDNVFLELLNIVKETGLSALIATHNMDLAGKMDREILIQKGSLIEKRAAVALENAQNFY